MDQNGQSSAPPAQGEFDLHHDAWGRLVLVDAQGRKHVGVEPVRAFPISEPGGRIAICDSEWHEIAYVDDLAELAPALRQLLEEELSRREFLPVIRRIVKVGSDSLPASWQVETDRGPTTFSLDGDEDIRRLGPHRALIVDSRGIRYLVPDSRVLDAASRRALERYL